MDKMTVFCGNDGDYHLARQDAYPTVDDFLAALVYHEEEAHDAPSLEDLRLWYEFDRRCAGGVLHPESEMLRWLDEKERWTRSVWARCTRQGSEPGIWYETVQQVGPKPSKGGWFAAWEYSP